MNRVRLSVLLLLILSACSSNDDQAKRIQLARAGNTTLYYDEIPLQIRNSFNGNDSTGIIRNYINKWAKRELMLQRAVENLQAGKMDEINEQLKETRNNLIIYEYQRMMMLEKMDTLVTDTDLENYYNKNQKSFMLASSIIKAVFIRLPVETPNIWKIRSLARSKNPKDFQELAGLCFQFAEKFDDFNDEWITPDKLSIELNEEFSGKDDFLRRNSFYEKNDSSSVYMVSINDYRLRGTIAPFDYVREDIRRIIWNNRRIEFIQTLENGIYNEAIQDNRFKTIEK